MTSPALRHALSESGDPVLRPLPDPAVTLLEALAAPPRLAAHLRAVHDVACQLVDWCETHYPALRFDRHSVLFGAATHDIGKAVHVSELSGPGSAHQLAGFELLIDHGCPVDLARFAHTHATWQQPDRNLEDLLVSLADKVWKAKRVPDLEQLVVEQIAASSGQQPWEVFMALDDALDRIAAGADQRLAYQSRHPLDGGEPQPGQATG